MSKREMNMVDPIFLTEYVEKVGTAKASKELGYSQAALTTALRDQKCKLALERLSEFLLGYVVEPTAEPAPTNQVLICQVPPEQTVAFTAVAAAMNISTTQLQI